MMYFYIVVITIIGYIIEGYLFNDHYKQKYASKLLAETKNKNTDPIAYTKPITITIVCSKEDMGKLSDYRKELVDLRYTFTLDDLQKQKEEKEEKVALKKLPTAQSTAVEYIVKKNEIQFEKYLPINTMDD